MKFSRKFAATSSRAEIICAIDEVRELLRTGVVTAPDTVRQAREAIKDLERELVARWEVAVLKRRRQGRS